MEIFQAQTAEFSRYDQASINIADMGSYPASQLKVAIPRWIPRGEAAEKSPGCLFNGGETRGGETVEN